jgi:hypothetical protein
VLPEIAEPCGGHCVRSKQLEEQATKSAFLRGGHEIFPHAVRLELSLSNLPDDMDHAA